ncbi:MFS transporter [Rhizobium sp. KVB221]|uniref:MFS transporter n=1 Tax=Rhizobium setariae TaxID=2801340 RepID=A0A936YIW6_9HYPH|nr:MFS transporter [Rhizobium setariae]
MDQPVSDAESVPEPAKPAPAAAPAPIPLSRSVVCILAAVFLSLSQGLGMNFIAANILQIQGSFGATTNEATWLLAAYMVPNASLSLIMVKVRNQYGLRSFAEIGILVFVAISIVHLFVDDFNTALVLRFFAGAAASPMSSLGFLYMLEAFPLARKMNWGLCASLANIAIAAPLARILSPTLLDIGGWHAMYMFEVALALIAFAFVYLVKLTPMPRAKVIGVMDIVSYLFIGAGFGCLAIVLTLGRLYWWTEAPWLGELLVASIVALTAAAVIELNRKSPLLDIRWITSREILHLTGVLLIFRVALTAQTSGSTGFSQVLGLAPETAQWMWVAVLAVSIIAGLGCAFLMQPGREPLLHIIALVLIAAGSYMDAFATNLTRPDQMIVSQMLIAAGGAFFLPPALRLGLMSALKNGPNYILSFIVIFLFTQSLGGLLGSALLGSFVTLREKFHSSYLVEQLPFTDPLVASRVSQLGGAYGRVLTDKALQNAEGVQLLGQLATREANILAYNDLYYLTFIICVAALAALLIHVLYDALKARLQPNPATAAQS